MKLLGKVICSGLGFAFGGLFWGIGGVLLGTFVDAVRVEMEKDTESEKDNSQSSKNQNSYSYNNQSDNRNRSSKTNNKQKTNSNSNRNTNNSKTKQSQNPLKKYYTLLGINENATKEQIKSAYKAKAKEFHPDMLYSKGLTESQIKQANLKFGKIKEAYDILSAS